MLIFDQLKKNDPQLRLLAGVVFAGMAGLLAGLWWVQVVSVRDYQANLETQSFRTVRTPAVRGKILDRTGTNVLAENRPAYNVSLYLEELQSQFQQEYKHLRPTQVVTNSLPFWKRWLGSRTVETRYVKLDKNQLEDLFWNSRYQVASNAVMQISRQLQRPLAFDPVNFKKHYQTRLALPYPLAQKIGSNDIARFEEQSSGTPGTDLEIQSTRFYPHQTTAAHLLGHLQKDDRSVAGEEAFFNYRLPDYRGAIGIESAFDAELHGRAGAKSVVVNNLGYRQTENIFSPAEPGRNVVLTIDLQIQQAAERALQLRGPDGDKTRGAVVVMDVRSGDILALVSSPSFDPNFFVERQNFSTNYYPRVQALSAEKNRATQENYQPGSIFKTVVALACLDNGLDPNAIVDVKANPQDPLHGMIYVHGRSIRDTAPPGQYDFKHALIHSSNSYFITNGIRVGVEKIVELGRRLHLGERCDLGTRQETPGTFPSEKRLRSGWSDGDTANICIGQGYIDVTPLQMAVLASALANGGNVLWPRLVDRIESQDPLSSEAPTVFPKGQVRDTLGAKPRSMQILRDAMLSDVEDRVEGTGWRAAVPGMRICAKTGTAQLKDEHNVLVDYITWFLSYAPYENPKYAVVVMVEGGGSGGSTCAPIAHDVYVSIQEQEKTGASHKDALARAN